MAGITFPNIAGTLAPLMQLDLAAERNAFDRERARKSDEADAQDREDGKYLGPALQGDKAAQARVMSNPKYAPLLSTHLERLDKNQRAKIEEDAKFITSNGMAILNAAPEAQPGLYARVRQEAQAAGRDVSTWPTQYDPGWVKFNVDKAMTAAEYYKKSGEGVTFAPPAGGGPAPAGGGVSSNNIGNVRPVGGGPSAGFQQPPTLDDGIRLAVNNVKAYPAKFNNGQPMTLLQIGERWAPRGDGANDPVQWARNVASIGGLDPTKPLNFNDPQTAAAFARGVHGAEHGANKVLPLQQYAQAITGGATPPGLAQGSDMPAGANGTPLPPAQQALAPLRGLQLPPGARVALKGGLPVIQDGTVLYLDANGGWGAVPLPPRAAPKEQGAGPFAGTGMDQQAMNILLRGDPASPEYALAYSHLSKARTTINDEGRPVTIQPMDLSAVRRPTGAAAPQPQTGGGAIPPVAAPAPGVAPPPAAPGAGVTTNLPGGGTVTVGEPVSPKGPSSTEMAKLRTARAEAEQITAAANDFKKEWEKASPLERARSMSGANTPLNAAYNNFALLAKGDALFKLGVLNGPDLEIIRRTIPDPSTWKSITTTGGDVTSSVDKVLSILNAGISATEKQLNITQPQQKPAPQGATKGTYTGPDNKPISWQEIEATAKNRGMSTDEVIGRLGLKPTGMQ